MRFSVWASHAQPWNDVLELAQYADEAFWHSIYVADHFMANGDGPQDALEGTAVLAALAAATSRIHADVVVEDGVGSVSIDDADAMDLDAEGVERVP